ncbi:HupE/UreJ family protein [Myxococcota bacterium]|nr:HupE/UreJ family protein [Myxococcota bacterium]
MRPRIAPLLAGLAAAVAVGIVPGAVRAHQVGLSYGEYEVRGHEVGIRLKFSPEEVVLASPGVDADGDGALTPADQPRGREALLAATLARVAVSPAEGPCVTTAGPVAFDDVDGVVIGATARCAAPPSRTTFRIGYLADFPPGHRHLARVDGAGEVQEHVAYAAEPAFTAGGAPPTWTTASRFFALGVEHILGGIDHLLFLLGLLLVGGSLRELAGIVTSFTAAHSITLVLATLGVVDLGPRLVEPAIAASIVYVALENLRSERPRHRWRLTFAFGLVHGFGFAGVLKELDLPRSDLAASLVSFNLGVEAGQMCAVALALPALAFLGRTRWFPSRGVQAASLGLAAVGGVWFFERILG